jgi:hypothetical protein
LQTELGSVWTSKVLSGQITLLNLAVGTKPEVVAVSAIARFGVASSPAVLVRKPVR